MSPTLRVAVVDPNAAGPAEVQKTLESGLEACEVIPCGHDDESLAALAQSDVHIIVVAVDGPGIDLRKVLGHVRSESADIPVIALVGDDQVDEAAAALSQGLDDFVMQGVGDLQRLVFAVAAARKRVELKCRNAELEQELEFERENMRSIFNAMEDGVYIDDEDHNILFVNETLRNELGPVEDRLCFAYFNGFEEPCAWCRNDEVFEHGCVRGEWLAHHSGKRFDVFETMIQLRGEKRGKVGVFRDVTEMWERKQQLEETIRTQEALLRALPLGVGVIVDEKISDVNDVLCGLLSYQKAELVGMPLKDIFQSEDEARTVMATVSSEMSRSESASTESIIKSKNGEELRVLINCSANDLENPGAGMTLTVLDIGDRLETERELSRYRDGLEEIVAKRTSDLEKRMAEVEKLNRAMLNLADDMVEINADLEQTASKLEDANHELEAFAYSVSHDLRAPLRHIAGFVDILGAQYNEVVGEEGRRYINLISESAGRMGRLIDDLLTFSRAGRVDLFKTNVDLGSMVEAVRSEIERNAETTSIDWTIGPLPAVNADKATLRQVFLNLVGNAVKYSRNEECPRIEVGELDGGDLEVVIFVRDNGVGFDPKYAHKLFGVFQRLHRVDEFEGTGIGLANVRRIINRHNGRTWAEGEVGNGATFYFTLPKQDLPV